MIDADHWYNVIILNEPISQWNKCLFRFDRHVIELYNEDFNSCCDIFKSFSINLRNSYAKITVHCLVWFQYLYDSTVNLQSREIVRWNDNWWWALKLRIFIHLSIEIHDVHPSSLDTILVIYTNDVIIIEIMATFHDNQTKNKGT